MDARIVVLMVLILPAEATVPGPLWHPSGYRSGDTPVYLTLYGTGIRNRSSLSNVTVTINGISVPVLYAGPQPSFDGLDQVNVPLPLSLRGSGEVPVVLTADGQSSNTVTINIQ